MSSQHFVSELMLSFRLRQGELRKLNDNSDGSRPFAILQKSLDRTIFSSIFVRKVRLSSVRASFGNSSKLYQSFIRFRFLFKLTNRSLTSSYIVYVLNHSAFAVRLFFKGVLKRTFLLVQTKGSVN